MARKQLVIEKGTLEQEYQSRLEQLQPEIEELRKKVKYLSKINLKVKQAQEVTEGFVQEVVDVNDQLAKQLKEKKRQIRELSKTRQMRRSESCGEFDQIKFSTLSRNHQPINIIEVEANDTKEISNSQDTSCDSSEKARQSRFGGTQKHSLRKRAFSSIINFGNLDIISQIFYFKLMFETYHF